MESGERQPRVTINQQGQRVDTQLNLALDGPLIKNVYIGSVYARGDYAAETSDLLEFYARRFAGREDEMRQLLEFAASEKGGYSLVESPPAFGKSALLANVIAQWRARVAGVGSTPGVAYFFVQKEGGRNTAVAFLSAVNGELLTLLGIEGGVPPEPGSLRAQFTELWSRASSRAHAGGPLLLIVDGLDTAADETVSVPSLLPASLPPWVHVIVSCRMNPSATTLVPLNHPLRAPALMLQLVPLVADDVVALLKQGGMDASSAPHVPGRILAFTAGAPLMTRFVCEEIAADGPNALERLEAARPRGVEDYFAQQVESLRETARYPMTRAILGLMLGTLGPIGPAEIAEALDAPLWDVDEAVRPILRFFVGRERYELMDSQFRRTLARLFSRADRSRHSDQVLRWCRTYEEAGWPDTTPRYVLDHYVGHLRSAGDIQTIYGLIGPLWMRTRWLRDGSHAGYVRDVLDAMDAAASERPPNLFQQVRGALIIGGLVSGHDHVQPAALAALARAGLAKSAAGYAELIPSASNRALAWLRIARAHADTQSGLHLWTAIGAAHEASRWVLPMRLRADCRSSIAALLAEVGRGVPGAIEKARALAESTLTIATIAWDVENPLSRVPALLAAASAFAATGALERIDPVRDQVIAALEGMTLPAQATVRAVLASVLRNAGRNDVVAQLMQGFDAAAVAAALESADWQCDVSYDLVRALIDLGRLRDAFVIANHSGTAVRVAGNLAQISLEHRRRGEPDAAVEDALQAAIGSWANEMQRSVTPEEESEETSTHRTRSGYIVNPDTVALEEQVVKYLAVTGRTAAVRRRISQSSGEERLRLLAFLSEELARDGRVEEAKSTAFQALELPADAELKAAEDEFRMRFAVELARRGHVQEATTLNAAIGNRGRQRSVETALAAEWARRGEHEKAAAACHSAVSNLPAGFEDPVVVREVIEVLGALGRYRAALDLADSIQDRSARLLALSLIAEKTPAAGSRAEFEAAFGAMSAFWAASGPADTLEEYALEAALKVYALVSDDEQPLVDWVRAMAGDASPIKATRPALEAIWLWRAATIGGQDALRERARVMMHETLDRVASGTGDHWHRLFAFGEIARVMEQAGLPEAQRAARLCLDEFRMAMEEW